MPNSSYLKKKTPTNKKHYSQPSRANYSPHQICNRKKSGSAMRPNKAATATYQIIGTRASIAVFGRSMQIAAALLQLCALETCISLCNHRPWVCFGVLLACVRRNGDWGLRVYKLVLLEFVIRVCDLNFGSCLFIFFGLVIFLCFVRISVY